MYTNPLFKLKQAKTATLFIYKYVTIDYVVLNLALTSTDPPELRFLCASGPLIYKQSIADAKLYGLFFLATFPSGSFWLNGV